MGFFADLFKPKNPADDFVETKRENGIVTYETAPRKIGEVAGIEVTTNFFIWKGEEDEKIAELNRRATQFKDAKEWDKAIECLQKAQLRMKKSPTWNPIESWLRLPLFLQQAGRFDEAMEQFDWLLGEVDEWHAVGYSHRPKSVQKKLANAAREIILGKIELAKRREEKKQGKLKVDSSPK